MCSGSDYHLSDAGSATDPFETGGRWGENSKSGIYTDNHFHPDEYQGSLCMGTVGSIDVNGQAFTEQTSFISSTRSLGTTKEIRFALRNMIARYNCINQSILSDYHSVSETTGSTITCGEWGSPQHVGLNANNIFPMIYNHTTVGSRLSTLVRCTEIRLSSVRLAGSGL